jgi:hypothetical protein
MNAMSAEPLRLLALDADDLDVISAALQDAVVKVGDIVFERGTQRLTVAFNRYRWEAGGRMRVRSALQLGYVEAVQARRVRRAPKDAVLELLALSFDPRDAPGGVIVMTFAGGGDLRIQVECVDAVLADVSAPWPTPRSPDHKT